MRTDRNYSTPLTPMELIILHWMAHGYSTNDIAQQTDTSHHTVKFHIENIRSKMGQASRVAVVIKALKTGLIKLDEIILE